MLRIWGRINSINVQKVLWCADELGLEYQRIDAGMDYGVNTEPWYRERNPNATVPLMDDDGFSLWESNVIVRYLAAKHDPALCPPEPRRRADIERWMDWQQTTLMPGLTPLFWNLIRTAPARRDAAAITTGIEASASAMRLLDGHLAGSGGSYLCGRHFSVADIPAGAAAYRWYSLPIARPELGHLLAWYRRLSERPAFQNRVMVPLS